MIPFIMLSVLLGGLATAQSALNARAGQITGDIGLANLVFWATGAAMSAGLYLLRPDRAPVQALSRGSAWLYAAGVLTVVLNLGKMVLIPKIGVANFVVSLIAGQLLFAAVLSGTGWLADDPTPVSGLKIIGLSVMAVGCYLAVKN